MELIYLWVSKYKNLENLGFNFSSKFDVDINWKNGKESIVIKEKVKNKNIFQNEQKINNVTTIIGKNGTGKSNILNLIGIRRDGRVRLREENSEYLLIYHYDKNLFVIEGSNYQILSPVLEGLKLTALISNPFSMLVRYENYKLKYLGYLQMHEEVFKNNVILSYRNFYDKEMASTTDSFEISQEYSVLFNRIYLSDKNTGHLAKYKMLIDFYKQEKEEFRKGFKVFKLSGNTNLRLKMDIYNDSTNKVKLKMKKNFNPLISFEEERKKYKSKTHFINRLAYSLCKMLVDFSMINESQSSEVNKTILKLPKNLSYVEYCLEIARELYKLKAVNDMYFNETEMLLNIHKEYFSILNKIEDKYFTNERIIVPTNTKYDKDIGDFLELLNKINKIDPSLHSLVNLLSVNYDSLSSGEEALISLFSALHHGLNEPIFSESNNAILLLDEPDNFMHPEWNRMLLNEIIQFLNMLETNYKTYQLIITTHSPFLVSDLPKENIIALEKDYDLNISRVVNIGNTFASNIHTLLSEDFFMTSTIGEFAKTNIDQVIDLILKREYLTYEEKERILYIIDIIGEPILKDRLSKMYNMYFGEGEDKLL